MIFNPYSNRRGSALATAVIFSALILLVVTGSVSTTVYQARSQGRSLAYKQALALAEAGADHAVAELNAGSWSGWSTSGANRVLSNKQLTDASGNNMGTYTVTVYNAASANPRIDSVGKATYANTGTVLRRLVVPAKGNSAPSFFGPYGVYSAGNIEVNANARTDGYDSSVGAYGVNGNKGLSHNVAAVGYADLKANSYVGNIQTGGNIFTDNNNAKMTSKSPYNMPTAPPPFPDTELAAAKVTNNNANIKVYSFQGNKETLVKTGIPTNGAFNFNGLNVNGTMRIKMPAGTYYINTLQINSNAEIINDGPVKIFMDPGAGQTALHMNSNTSMNAVGANPKPSDLQLFIKSGNVNFNSNFKIYAGIFAPNTKFHHFNSQSYLYGAIVAGDIKMNSNAGIYVDKSMMSTGAASGYMALSWTEMQPPNA